MGRVGQREGRSALGSQPMTWSKHWDKIAAEAVRTGSIEPLMDGRRIEMLVMGLILFPARIKPLWDDGAWADLAYLGEAIRSWPPKDLDKTDPALNINICLGLSEIERTGWRRRLDPDRLRDMEDMLATTLLSQAAEGIVLTPEEVLQVRRRLTVAHLGSSDLGEGLAGGGGVERRD